MTFDEKVFIGLALAGIAAVILWRNRDPVPSALNEPGEALPASAYVGLSLTPDNTNVVDGPMYLMGNGPYAYWPPLNNFLPTVTSGQIGQVTVKPLDFVRRWTGTLLEGN